MALTRGSVGNVSWRSRFAEIPRVDALVTAVLSMARAPLCRLSRGSGTGSRMIITAPPFLPNTMAPMLRYQAK